MDNTPSGPVAVRVEDQRRPGWFAQVLRDLGALVPTPSGARSAGPEYDDERNMSTGWERLPGGTPSNFGRELPSMMLGRPVTQYWRTGINTFTPVQIARGTGKMVGGPELDDQNSGMIFPRGVVRGR